MTYEEYFEGLGCSPEEVEICSAAQRAVFAREIEEELRNMERGCLYVLRPGGLIEKFEEA